MKKLHSYKNALINHFVLVLIHIFYSQKLNKNRRGVNEQVAFGFNLPLKLDMDVIFKILLYKGHK